MSYWHPVDTDCQGRHGNDGDYYKICPVHGPDNVNEVWVLTLEVDDEDGTVKELGRFEDIVDAQLFADQHYQQNAPERNTEVIDSELGLLSAVREAARESGAKPSTEQIDKLPDERNAASEAEPSS